MQLTPVSFGKGRTRVPRLSPARMPGRRDPRFWTAKEEAVLRRYFPIGGLPACAVHLPNRSAQAIYCHAQVMGLHTDRQHRERQAWDERRDEIDRRLREAWPGLHGRGALAAFAASIGVSRWVVSKRALALGLTSPHKKEPPWTAAEEALLRKVPLHAPELAARTFRAHGFRRTATAIMVRATRLGLSRRYRETLSANAAARIVGVDPTTVTDWCHRGELKATRRGTNRLPQQGGDAWAIRHADLRAFVTTHPERIDIRKVDKLAFIALLTGQLDPAKESLEEKPA